MNTRPSGGSLRLGAGSHERRQSSTDLREQGFNSVSANAWPAGDWIVFSGLQGETQTLWKVQIDPYGEVLGKAVRATEDAQGDSGASFANGKLVFTRTRVDMNLWALPLDSTGEHLTGSPEPLTSSPARKGQESAPAKDCCTAPKTATASRCSLKTEKKKRSCAMRSYSVLAPDGAHYAYGEGTKEQLNCTDEIRKLVAFWSRRCARLAGCRADSRQTERNCSSGPIRRRSTHLDMLDLATRQRLTGSCGPGKNSRARDFRPTAAGSASSPGWGARVADVRRAGLAGKAPRLLRLGADHAGFRFVPLRVLVGAQRSDLHPDGSRRRREPEVASGAESRYRNQTSHRRQLCRSTSSTKRWRRGWIRYGTRFRPSTVRIILELGGVSTNIWIK